MTVPTEPPVAPPVSTKLSRNRILEIIDWVLLGIYTVEMLLKWFAMGLFAHPRSYFRSAWNILDFIVVVTRYFWPLNYSHFEIC